MDLLTERIIARTTPQQVAEIERRAELYNLRKSQVVRLLISAGLETLPALAPAAKQAGDGGR